MARAAKKMVRGDAGPKGHQHVSDQDPDTLFDEDDLASEIKGRNSLQGVDQQLSHNERHAVADATNRTEGIIESFAHADPKARAKAAARARKAKG